MIRSRRKPSWSAPVRNIQFIRSVAAPCAVPASGARCADSCSSYAIHENDGCCPCNRPTSTITRTPLAAVVLWRPCGDQVTYVNDVCHTGEQQSIGGNDNSRPWKAGAGAAADSAGARFAPAWGGRAVASGRAAARGGPFFGDCGRGVSSLPLAGKSKGCQK